MSSADKQSLTRGAAVVMEIRTSSSTGWASAIPDRNHALDRYAVLQRLRAIPVSIKLRRRSPEWLARECAREMACSVIWSPAIRGKKNYLSWRRIAIAYYGGDPMGGEVEVRSGPTLSSFKAEAVKLDGKGKEYYSIVEEMAARAFQSWIEVRLADQGRRNDYLSTYADNSYYVDPISGTEWKPYPEGEERLRINAAFDHLAAAVRKHLKS